MAKKKQDKAVKLPDRVSNQEEADLLASTFEKLSGQTVYVVEDMNVFTAEIYAEKYAARKKLKMFKSKV